MKRSAGNVVLGAAMLVALAGCAYQDPLELPDLGPPTASSPSPYGSYSPYYSYGYNYGYGSGYRPGYDPYYNNYYGADPRYYYYGADPRYYAPGVVYVPYTGGGQTDGKHDGVPRWPQDRNDETPRTAPPPPPPPQVRAQEMPRRAAPSPDRGPRVTPSRARADDGSPPRSPD